MPPSTCRPSRFPERPLAVVLLCLLLGALSQVTPPAEANSVAQPSSATPRLEPLDPDRHQRGKYTLPAEHPPVAPTRQPSYAYEPRVIEVSFHEKYHVRLVEGVPSSALNIKVRPQIAALVHPELFRWSRITSLPESEVDRLHDEAEAASGRDLYNLNGVMLLWSEGEFDLLGLCAQLERLDAVQTARPLPRPVLPPGTQLNGQQRHLGGKQDGPPIGLGFREAWTRPGADGNGVVIVDVEYSWNFEHRDLPGLYNGLILEDGSSYSDPDPPNGMSHGTAVAGVLSAAHNDFGVDGAVPAARLMTSPTYIKLGGDPYPVWQVAGAILNSLPHLKAGDVILLEQQFKLGLSRTDYLPIEWWGDVLPNQTRNPVYSAIETATARGIHVVQAAGNGSVNLDQINWLDSGAIIVGAGSAGGRGMLVPSDDLVPLMFSCYGWRVDVQAWGENVVTAGYGDLQNEYNDDYTAKFAGTSSAAALVAGAVAGASSYWRGLGHDPAQLTPRKLRELLRATGLPQAGTYSRQIGPRPYLPAVLDALDGELVILAQPPKVLLGGFMQSRPTSAAGGSVDLMLYAPDQRLSRMRMGVQGAAGLLNCGYSGGGVWKWSTTLPAELGPTSVTVYTVGTDSTALWPYLTVQ